MARLQARAVAALAELVETADAPTLGTLRADMLAVLEAIEGRMASHGGATHAGLAGAGGVGGGAQAGNNGAESSAANRAVAPDRVAAVAGADSAAGVDSTDRAGTPAGANATAGANSAADANTAAAAIATSGAVPTTGGEAPLSSPPVSDTPTAPGADADANAHADAAATNDPTSASPPVAIELVPIERTSFDMGAEKGREQDLPRHRVNLSPFAVAARLVTNAEYAAFVAANPQWQVDRIDAALHDGKYLEHWVDGGPADDQAQHPVCYVPFAAAEACAAWLGKRLLTEAEWECAARGGLAAKKFPNGNAINDKSANFAKRQPGTTPVGQYPANGYGLYDMAGNVFEWTTTFYAPYQSDEVDDPSGPTNGEYLVVRGGSWASTAAACRVDFRVDELPTRCGYVGFRVAESGLGS